MTLTRADLRNAKELRKLVEVVRDLKELVKRSGPAPAKLPRIGLDVDPVWVRKNAKEATKKIERLHDALVLAISYADAARGHHKRYKAARPLLIEAMCSPREHD